MPIADRIICPLMGGKCIEDGAIVDNEIHACRFWVEVSGKHPQDGSDIKGHDCSFALLPVLLIENARVGRQVGAAVESARNESAQRTDVGNVLLAGMLRAVGGSPSAIPSIENIKEVPAS